MLYQVRYRLTGRRFWVTLKKVVGDFVAKDIPIPTRVFILDDETRIEVPIGGTEFEFSKERFLSMKESAEKEAGQKLPIERH